MRLFSLAAMLALGIFVGLPGEKAPAAGKKPSTSKPSSGSSRPPANPQNYRPTGGAPGWMGNYRPNYRPPNYRPGQGAKVVPVKIDVNFTFNTEVGKVRTLDPPTEFDEKGNIKKHTKEELQALKGDTPADKKLVGYKSDFDQLQTGDIVQVAFSVYRTTSNKKAKPGKKKDEEEKDVLVDPDKPKEGKWVVVAQLLGKVTKINAANTDSQPKMTIQVSTMTVVQGNQRPPANKPQTVNPEHAQATLILAGRRPPEKPPM